MQQTLFILAGISSSGKSTYAQTLAQQTGAVIISTDSIRKELSGTEEDQSKNGLIFTVILPRRIHEALKEGKSVIVDATSLKPVDRANLSVRANFNTRLECHYTEPDVKRALKFQEGRQRKVPESVIHKQASKFVTPTYHEGFDRIYNITKDCEIVGLKQVTK